MSQKESQIAFPWREVTEDKMVKYTSWDSFINDFCRSREDGKYPVEYLTGLLHWGAKIEDLSPRERLERVLFYAYFATQGEYAAQKHPESPMGSFRKTAYRELVERVLGDLSASISYLYHDDREAKDVDLFVAAAQAITKFFRTPVNKPETPKHKSQVAFCLNSLCSMHDKMMLRVVLARAAEQSIDVTQTTFDTIRSGAIKALVACHVYQTIVDNKIFDAVVELARVGARGRNGLEFAGRMIACRNVPDENTKRLIAEMSLAALNNDIKTAQDAWICLWSLRTLEKLEKTTTPLSRRTSGGMIGKDVL